MDSADEESAGVGDAAKANASQMLAEKAKKRGVTINASALEAYLLRINPTTEKSIVTTLSELIPRHG